MTYLLGFFIPALFVLLLTPLAMRVAQGAGMMDLPGERRIHQAATPRAGGLVLLPVVFAALAAGWWGTITLLYLGLALAIIFAVGLWDDRFGAHFSTKFFAQTTAALVVVAAGVQVHIFPWDLANVLLTVGWIVGITNAINLIDGLDGLAGGLAVNALLSIGTIALLAGSVGVALFCFILAGGVLGFLRFNLHPARAFLGDSGSLLLGFSIAVMSIRYSSKTATFLIVAVPVLFIAIPMADTLIAFARRSLRGDHPFKPDKEHLHHKLLELNFTPQQTLAYFYSFSVLLGVASFAFAQTRSLHALVASLLVLAAMILVVRAMQVVNFHRAIAGFNLRLARVRSRMRSDGESDRRADLLRLCLALLVAVDLVVSAAVGPPMASPLLAATLGICLLIMRDLVRVKVEVREHSFPWLSLGTLLLLFLGQLGLLVGFRGKGLGDNLLLLLLLASVFAATGLFLLSRRRFEAFLIHPIVIPAFYGCALAGALVGHTLGFSGLLPLVVVMGNTALLYFACVLFSRRVLFSGTVANALAFVAMLAATTLCWVV